MPAESEAQRKLMCIALSIKRGKTPASYSAEAAKLAKTMSESDLEEYCHGAKEKGNWRPRTQAVG